MKKDKKDCEKSCRGRIINKAKGVYCDHIERRLPKYSSKSIKALLTDKIDWFSSKLVIEKEVPEVKITKALKAYGLQDYEIEMLLLRYFDDKSMKELIREQGWVSRNSANHYLKKILKKLREGKFKL